MTLLSRSNGKGGKLGVSFGEHPDTREVRSHHTHTHHHNTV